MQYIKPNTRGGFALKDKFNINLPSKPEFIIERLNRSGFRADVVGGPVRDYLLGKIPDDYDFTTGASPEQVKEVFSDKRIIETGIKHGTVTLVLEGESFEITTYRIDGEYKDSRHPESVSFTDRIEEDLARRDFTMNAIAYNLTDGITDPFCGREDIKNRLIRAVGEPEKRFTEDALRILRGARFSARLGFKVDPATRAAMDKKKELLRNVSSERIYVEWRKLLSADFAYDALTEFSGLISVFLPELSLTSLPDRKRFAEADYMTRLVALFYLSGVGSEGFSEAMRRLKTDSVTLRLGASALLHIDKEPHVTERQIGRLLYSVGAESARLTLAVEELLGIPSNPSSVDSYLDNKKPYRVSDLPINGDDIALLGAMGRQIGDLLCGLLLSVVDGEIKNDREELLRLAESRLKEK